MFKIHLGVIYRSNVEFVNVPAANCAAAYAEHKGDVQAYLDQIGAHKERRQ